MNDQERLVAAARKAEATARHHKSQSNRHRGLAKKARQKQAEIEAECARLGIKITYQPAKDPIHGQGTHSRSSNAH